jgi:hypothetical protein
VQNKKFKWAHVKEAFVDPVAWTLFLVSILNTIPVGGVGAYMNIIISENLGFSVLQTDLLSIAQAAILVSFLRLFTWMSKKTG